MPSVPLKFQRLVLHEVSIETRACSLQVPSVIFVRTVAFISVGGVSQKGLIDHSLNGLWSHVVWVGFVRKSAQSLSCHRCYDLSNSQELKYKSLRVLPSLSAVSESGSHVTAAVSGSVYFTTLAAFGVSEAGTLVYTLAHGGSDAHGVLSGSTLS
nr:hypothetical protein [Tanacetum cinerariifolium]